MAKRLKPVSTRPAWKNFDLVGTSTASKLQAPRINCPSYLFARSHFAKKFIQLSREMETISLIYFAN